MARPHKTSKNPSSPGSGKSDMENLFTEAFGSFELEDEDEGPDMQESMYEPAKKKTTSTLFDDLNRKNASSMTPQEVSTDSDKLKADLYNRMMANRTLHMNKTDEIMGPYWDLIDNDLYDEVFQRLEQTAQNIADEIEKKKYLRSFFKQLFCEEIFDHLLENDKWLEMSTSLLRALDMPFLVDIKNRFSSVIEQDQASVFFGMLTSSNRFEEASKILPYTSMDMSGFPSTLERITQSQNVQALRFMCENMKNIHFNNGALLRIAMDMPPEALKMLIQEFNFDINEQSEVIAQEGAVEYRTSMLHGLVAAENVKNFSFVVQNYANRIDFASQSMIDGRNMDIFDFINESNYVAKFYSMLLDYQQLKPEFMHKIAEKLLDRDMVKENSATDLYSKLFSHPNFDSEILNFGQHSFIYWMFATIGRSIKAANQSKTEDYSPYYIKVLDNYLQNIQGDIVPDAVEYHVLGTAIKVAQLTTVNKGDEEYVHPSALKLCSMIMKRYKSYINKPNPNGQLPIQQVPAESQIYTMLVTNGSVVPQQETGFVGKLVGLFSRKKQQPTNIVVPEVPEDSAPSFSALKASMRADFRVMREYLSSPSCDASIKMKCENIFLKADRIATVMENNNMMNYHEELHFLRNNFNNYLKESLRAYIDVVKAYNNLGGAPHLLPTVEKAKGLCAEHVDLLSQQVDLMSDNIMNNMSDAALLDLKTQSRFLGNKFEQASGRQKSEAPVAADTQEDILLVPKGKSSSTPEPVKAPVRDFDDDINLFADAEQPESPKKTKYKV